MDKKVVVVIAVLAVILGVCLGLARAEDKKYSYDV